MQLSEAIFLGSKLSPQGVGNFAMNGASKCALGSACEALGSKGSYSFIRFTYPWTIVKESCPIAGCNYGDTVSADGMDVIYHLNDIHLWTREAIAAWVANVEPREEPVSCPESVQTSLETAGVL